MPWIPSHSALQQDLDPIPYFDSVSGTNVPHFAAIWQGI